jgi:hypothetical protein
MRGLGKEQSGVEARTTVKRDLELALESGVTQVNQEESVVKPVQVDCR